MTSVIKQILAELPSPPRFLELIRSKLGVHVFRCEYEGRPAVVKSFEHAGDRREIDHYRLLKSIGVPTLNAYALGRSCIVMEDISASPDWRLGDEADRSRPSVLRALANWYVALHEAGENLPQLAEMYSENDELTPSAIAFLKEKLPGAEALCGFVLEHLAGFRSMLRERENTLTYNDFYFTNLLVRKNGTAAMMFDYNLMGHGYRYADSGTWNPRYRPKRSPHSRRNTPRCTAQSTAARFPSTRPTGSWTNSFRRFWGWSAH